MASLIHVLCSNFRQIVGETLRCFGAKKFAKCGFFGAILCPFEGAKSLQGSVQCEPMYRVKFRADRLRFAGVIPEN